MIPRELYQKSILKALGYTIRDVTIAIIVYKLAWFIEPLSSMTTAKYGYPPLVGWLLKWMLWSIYWYCQGVVLTSWWVLAHEAGHGNLSSSRRLNDLIGFPLHTVCLCSPLDSLLTFS